MQTIGANSFMQNVDFRVLRSGQISPRISSRPLDSIRTQSSSGTPRLMCCAPNDLHAASSDRVQKPSSDKTCSHMPATPACWDIGGERQSQTYKPVAWSRSQEMSNLLPHLDCSICQVP